ncbi:hypothetical protein C2S53_007943 [Perilla frutescens var. hirtella]|uniref:Uncharacterized protein n=1 Tax=Perilla frutescens var. hirtella TaxID=608512 RepID=A0AAD4J9V8_PERFH|nr:hypothetical protein C2S53_007943 [Perilla frutescens var. hirtella]
MATSSSPPIPITVLLNSKNTLKHKNFNDVQCLFLRQSNFQRISSTRPSNKDLVVRRATPEAAGDILSSFPLNSIPGFADHPWVVGICGLLVGVPLMIQRLVAFTKQIDVAAQTMENIADTVEKVADSVDKAAEEFKEGLPEGRLKQAVAFVEDLAEDTSDTADKVGDIMDKVGQIDDKLEEFLDKNFKGNAKSKPES